MSDTHLDGDTIVANAHALGPAIEAAADDIARNRRVPDDLIQAMQRAGVFRIAFPRAWGGPEMDILQQCELMEILGYHDASVGWVAMICSDSGHYAARVEESVAREHGFQIHSHKMELYGLCAACQKSRRQPGVIRGAAHGTSSDEDPAS